MSPSVVGGIISEASLLISDQDLNLASHSLDLLATLVRVYPECEAQIDALVVPKAMELVQSPLLQGTALASLERFFVSMSSHFDLLFQSLLKELSGKVQQLSTARCIAALCCQGAPSKLSSTLQTLIDVAKEAKIDSVRRLALLCLGEIGRMVSLSEFSEIETLLTQNLEDPQDDIKTAASYALGAMTLGNLSQYLPSLVAKIESKRSQNRQLYLLLKSMIEVISSLNRSKKPNPISQGKRQTYQSLLKTFFRSCRRDP